MVTPSNEPNDAIDFAELAARLRRGFLTITALSLLCLALGLIIGLAVVTKQTAVSTLRVTFGFPGFERGAYPNGAKFQVDDIRSPDVVNEAIKRLGLQATAADITSKI